MEDTRCVQNANALTLLVQNAYAVAAASGRTVPWQAASELSRLRPKRLERLVHPDARDANFFFPDVSTFGEDAVWKALFGMLRSDVTFSEEVSEPPTTTGGIQRKPRT